MELGLQSKGLNSSQTPSLIAESSALKKGANFLNVPGIGFGENVAGYEYKHWIPMWIPFIQASTLLWGGVTSTPDTQHNWQNGGGVLNPPGAEHLPFNIFIPSGQHFDFQLFTPRDHPFLLLDVKVSANLVTFVGVDPPVPTVHSRFKGPFVPFSGAPTAALFRKLAYPDNELLETTIFAVSPGGKPVWGATQNSVGMDNSVRTVGPVPHIERVSLANSQCSRSGRGTLQHHLLFPPEGVLRVTVENRNVNLSTAPSKPDGAYVTGVAFGYVIME